MDNLQAETPQLCKAHFHVLLEGWGCLDNQIKTTNECVAAYEAT